MGNVGKRDQKPEKHHFKITTIITFSDNSYTALPVSP